ncbi:hypothetical protein EDB81DRAFT_808913 [Dactylonectria macrodidyma]|uniref:J domain-containing protein n=1 Tax=Dactylonectria macrodidyma TaxID=307937 RepID=A0A9P9DZ96_9HYPO|nr:hypothetical protein EDB81DRAFT_808913 [Dactylonectria macrodidyma]
MRASNSLKDSRRWMCMSMTNTPLFTEPPILSCSPMPAGFTPFTPHNCPALSSDEAIYPIISTIQCKSRIQDSASSHLPFFFCGALTQRQWTSRVGSQLAINYELKHASKVSRLCHDNKQHYTAPPTPHFPKNKRPPCCSRKNNNNKNNNSTSDNHAQTASIVKNSCKTRIPRYLYHLQPTMAPLSCSVDYYAVLGVPYTADEATIKSAYRRLAHLKHPDKNGDTPESTAEFQLLQSAYATLGDRKQRRRFDRQYLPAQPKNPYNYKWHFTFSHQIFTVTGPCQTISPQPYRWGSAYSRREMRQTKDHNGTRQGDKPRDKNFTDIEEVRCRADEIKRVAEDRVQAERDRKESLQADLEARRERVEEMRRTRQEMDDRRRESERKLAARK